MVWYYCNISLEECKVYADVIAYDMLLYCTVLYLFHFLFSVVLYCSYYSILYNTIMYHVLGI